MAPYTKCDRCVSPAHIVVYAPHDEVEGTQAHQWNSAGRVTAVEHGAPEPSSGSWFRSHEQQSIPTHERLVRTNGPYWDPNGPYCEPNGGYKEPNGPYCEPASILVAFRTTENKHIKVNGLYVYGRGLMRSMHGHKHNHLWFMLHTLLIYKRLRSIITRGVTIRGKNLSKLTFNFNL